VAIEILFCGVCHSDLHTVRGEWAGTSYPCVPGHEIVGRVTAVGEAVSGFAPGDLAAVGCMVDSCRTCEHCRAGLESYCIPGATFTYDSPDLHLGGRTMGGYSTAIVVDRDFVLRVPGNLDLAGAAPLLCAGITTWSPLQHWKVGPASTVGIVGLGGLGHMAIKLAHALGAEVVAFTTSAGKVDDARRLGAREVVLSHDAAAMRKQARRFNFILNTLAVSHNLDPFISALKRDGTMCLVGAPPDAHPSPSAGKLVAMRRSLAGSFIGGLPETQELLDFCGAHEITADVEVIPMQEINTAYERMLRSDVRYRFSIDMGSLR